MRREARVRAMGLLVSALGAAALAQTAPSRPDELLDHPQWRSLLGHVAQNHLDPPDPAELQAACLAAARAAGTPDDEPPIERCLRAAAQTMGGPAEYVTPKALAAQRRANGGGFASLGLELKTRPPGQPLTVVSAFEGGPAQRAGLRYGDEIVAVDDRDTQPLAMGEALALLRGAEGSSATLRLRRPGQPGTEELTLARAVVQVNGARAHWLGPGVAYLRLSQFHERIAQDLERSLRGLLGEGRASPDALVLDLRNNLGGLVEVLPAVASFFAPAGQVVLKVTGRSVNETYRTGDRGSRFPAPREDPSLAWARSVPLLVLMNPQSAGSSEVLAQFLRENRLARIAGTRSFGLAKVQYFVLLAGQAGLRFPVAWLESSHGVRWPQGLEPDLPLAPEERFAEPGSPQDAWAQRALELARPFAPQAP